MGIDWTQFAGQWVAARNGRHVVNAPTAREIVHRLRGTNAAGAVAWYEPRPSEATCWKVVHSDGRSGPNDLFSDREEADRWAASWGGASVVPHAWSRPVEAGAS